MNNTSESGGTVSPVINLMVNGKLCAILLDTENATTLSKRSTMIRLGLEIGQSKALPILTTVSGNPLKILGMATVNVHV